MAEDLLEQMQEEEAENTETQTSKFMSFQTGRESFGININYVNEIIQMQPITPVPEVKEYIKGLLNLRGKIIPIIDVRARFKMEPVAYTDRTCIIVIEVKNTVIGLIVEQLDGVDDILEDDIVPPPSLSRRQGEHNKYVYGLARTGDVVKLLIDPEKLIHDEDAEANEESQDEK